ncbi:transposase%2C ISSsu4%2C authentic frameshift [Streptococcus suis]|uniref:Transposase, ISSsu4, authentic frameshift n=1 Tax=Streptococcus suis TaxID=1307 RepID=A0A0Z8KPZ0_STRSU|nr:transposase%2C ISSsu4%2C authentic frameshift [Streptococcus suis]
MAQKAHSLLHTKWLCSTTLSSPLSIDEKLSIINIEVVLERYFDDCVVIKVLKLSKVI